MPSIARSLLRRYSYVFPQLYHGQYRLRTLLAARLGRGRVHEEDFFALKALLANDRQHLFLDVGGNIGQSVISLKALFPTAEIRSYEPNPAILRALTAVARGFDRVDSYGIALGESPGTLTLHVPWCRGVCFDQYTSASDLDPRALARVMREAGFAWANERDIRLEVLNVSVSTIDLQQLAPTFIKIDVEGAELAVLRGARRTLATHTPLVLLENRSDRQVQQLMAELGYAARRWTGNGFSPQGLEAAQNIFFIPRHLLERADGWRAP